MEYYLGIDIGTTSSKAVAFSTDGDVIETASFDYDMHHPQPDRSEQDPEEIYNAVLKGIHAILSKLSPHVPVFVSFSAAMHSLILVDHNAKPLSKAIIWADNRADSIAEELKETEHGKRFYRSTGVPIHSMAPLCKLLWFRQHESKIFNLAYKFISIKEYIFHRLFGDFVVDTSIASATGLLNIRTLDWEEEVLQFAGIDSSKLSKVVPVKQKFYLADTYPQLSNLKNTPFFIGASDGALSNLGTGATTALAMAVSIGTSGAARLVADKTVIDDEMRTFCYHLKDNSYIIGGGNNNGAGVLQWLKESFLQAEEDFEEFFKAAEAVAPGSEDLIFLPYIYGERAPIWNSNAKGVFFGLTMRHTKCHLTRAAMEGVIFALYSIGKILLEKNAVAELRASGGFARSDLWLQILADVFNTKVIVGDATESAALGAVMLGAEALGLSGKFKDADTITITPIRENAEVYRKSFQKFQRLYELLKQEMTETA